MPTRLCIDVQKDLAIFAASVDVASLVAVVLSGLLPQGEGVLKPYR